MKTNLTIVGIIIICVVSFGNYLNIKGIVENQPVNTLGSSIGNIANKATTTDATWNVANLPTRFKVLKTGAGWLSNVTITGATTATALNFYDATTTGSHNDHATTSIGIINVSTPAGTYVFDSAFSRGLIVEFPSAAGAASSTITWN